MLLTDRYAAGFGAVATWRAVAVAIVVTGDATRFPALHFLAAVSWRDLFFRRVFRCSILDHLAHHRTVAGHVGRQRLELGAVPFLELHHPGALVVETTRLHR